MQKATGKRWVLMVVSTIGFALAGHMLTMGCQEQRACRDNKPCRKVDAGPDGSSTTSFAYACDLASALCKFSCTKHEDCDLCNDFACVDGKCVKQEGARSLLVCKDDAGQPNGKTCKVETGLCPTKCEDGTCNQCAGYFCSDAGTGNCELTDAGPITCSEYACDPARGKCRERCFSNEHCNQCNFRFCVALDGGPLTPDTVGKCEENRQGSRPSSCPPLEVPPDAGDGG